MIELLKDQYTYHQRQDTANAKKKKKKKKDTDELHAFIKHKITSSLRERTVNYMVSLYLKIPDNFTRLILKDGCTSW